jgi:hypothetical protein
LTDVSRLRSYRCAIKPATAPTITVRRINSHVQSLTTGHESNPEVAQASLDCFASLAMTIQYGREML